MVTVKTYLRTHKADSEEGYIWVSFYLKREKINFTTGVKVRVKHWSVSSARISKQDPKAADKNLILENTLARINNVFVKYRLKDKKLTKDAFIRAYNRPDDYPTFFDFITDHERNLNFKSELSTLSTHKSVIKKVKEFAPNLHFDDITTEWLDEYYMHLRKKCKNNDNTAYKNISTFKKYVRYAFKKGYMDENPFDNWAIRRTKASYTYLTEDELNVLLNLYRNGDLEHKYHKTLEFFLFMCFSSLHIGDSKPLRLEQFTENSFTYFRIKNRNKKPEPIVIPISAALKSILKNIVGTRKQGLIFESLPADQTMNKYLKKIATDIGIHKKLSHKAARHTFATYYLKKTKDLTSLKEILGHSELRETLIYAHVLDESKQEGIKTFDCFEV
ncbi:MAG: site-specific integrase [Dysgonomonas sp.]|nr:site-specific integrase [Dysgonomonas sp.]